jgi:hypothetical protein
MPATYAYFSRKTVKTKEKAKRDGKEVEALVKSPDTGAEFDRAVP